MKRKTMKPNAYLCFMNGILFRSMKKLTRRFLTASLLLLFGAAFTDAKGQTVNYEYDANGNVTSKKVIQPLEVMNCMVKQDTVISFTNFLAYYPSFKAVSFSELISATSNSKGNAAKNLNELNNKSSKDKTPVISSSSNGNERYLLVESKNNDYNLK